MNGQNFVEEPCYSLVKWSTYTDEKQFFVVFYLNCQCQDLLLTEELKMKKKVFVTNSSFQLRTPISGLGSYKM
jgi:hypothetical protein